MAETTVKPRRIWKIVLVISLALNLAVAGIVGGVLVSGHSSDKGPRSFDLGVGPMARALRQDERQQIGRSLRNTRSIRELNPRARVADMVAVLQAEPFDPDALQALMAAQDRRMNAVQVNARAAFLETVIAMTPERRAAFAAQVAEGLSRPRRSPESNSGG